MFKNSVACGMHGCIAILQITVAHEQLENR